MRLDELFQDVTPPLESDQRMPRVKVLPAIRDELRSLDPIIQEKLISLILDVISGDADIIQLREAIDGLMLVRAGKYKIIYRWKLKTVEIVIPDFRGTAYRKSLSA